MDKEKFWRIIEFAHRNASGDARIQKSLIIKDLEQRLLDDIVDFECILRQSIIDADDFKIMAAAKIIQGYVSDDSYIYFRCWLIGQGEQVYTEALRSPDTLAAVLNKDTDTDFEPLLYVATQAYLSKAGKQEEAEGSPRFVASDRGLSYDYGSETKGEDWTPEQLPALLPKLWAKHG